MDAMDSHDDIAIARRVLAMEADGLGQLSSALDERFVAAVDAIMRAEGRVICTGIGKSGHVARKIAATMASTGTRAYFVHATEASHGDLGMISTDDVVLALSKSGETSELSDILSYARRYSIPLIGMTTRAGSALGESSTILLEIPDAPEACGQTNAPTTSTTLMMAMGDALAVALLERRGFRSENFKVFHPGGKLGAMLLTAEDIMHGGEALPLVESGVAIRDALDVLSARGFGVVAVEGADGRLAGIVTDGDIRRHVAGGKTAETIDEIMTSGPVVAERDTLAADMMRMMNEKKITQLIVVEEGVAVGLVHLHDLLRMGVA